MCKPPTFLAMLMGMWLVIAPSASGECGGGGDCAQPCPSPYSTCSFGSACPPDTECVPYGTPGLPCYPSVCTCDAKSGTWLCTGDCADTCIPIGCSTDADCDDGILCNGDEQCSVLFDCQPGTPPACDDSVDCTVDSCNTSTDQCDHVPNHNLCTEPPFTYCDAVIGCTATGACCRGDACFVDVPEDLCEDMLDGCFAGTGADCDACLIGACCVNGICVANQGEHNCVGSDLYWAGPATTCHPDICSLGDAEPDGDVDLRDFAHFQRCIRGDGVGACLFADMTGNGRINICDYRAFHTALESSGGP